MEQNYQVGIYCRLSKNDGNPGESTSIETQRSIALDYCEEHNYQVFNVRTQGTVCPEQSAKPCPSLVFSFPIWNRECSDATNEF